MKHKFNKIGQPIFNSSLIYKDNLGIEKLFIIKTKKSDPLKIDQCKIINRNKIKKNTNLIQLNNFPIQFSLYNLKYPSLILNFDNKYAKNIKTNNVKSFTKNTLSNCFRLNNKHFK